MQDLIVALIVVACTGYAAWTLMPSTLRRALAQQLLKLSLPAAMTKPLRKALQPAGACGGCDSCGDSAPSVTPKAAQPLKFHRRLRH